MYLNHIHNFRSFAICGIVGAHALHNFDWKNNQLMFVFFDSLFNESSIWFFFIAGFLFQYLSPRYNYGDYIVKKIKFVIAPYLILSIPALIASELWVRQEVPASFYTFPVWKQVSIFLLTGKHLAPFWFVPTISLFYLLAPLFIKMDRLKWPYLFLPLTVVLSAWLGRDGLLTVAGISGYFSPLSKGLYLFSVYFFGIFCSRYHQKVLDLMKKFHLPLLVFVLLFFFGEVFWHGRQVHYQYLFKIFSCPLIIYYLYVYDGILKDRFGYLGTVSFGLFFIHGYLLAALKFIYAEATRLTTLPGGNIFNYTFLVLFVLLVCTYILYLSRLYFGKNSRILVGC